MKVRKRDSDSVKEQIAKNLPPESSTERNLEKLLGAYGASLSLKYKRIRETRKRHLLSTSHK